MRSESNPTILGQYWLDSHTHVSQFVLITLHAMTAWYARQAKASCHLQNATEHSGQKDFTPVCKESYTWDTGWFTNPEIVPSQWQVSLTSFTNEVRRGQTRRTVQQTNTYIHTYPRPHTHTHDKRGKKGQRQICRQTFRIILPRLNHKSTTSSGTSTSHDCHYLYLLITFLNLHSCQTQTKTWGALIFNQQDACSCPIPVHSAGLQAV